MSIASVEKFVSSSIERVTILALKDLDANGLSLLLSLTGIAGFVLLTFLMLPPDPDSQGLVVIWMVGTIYTMAISEF